MKADEKQACIAVKIECGSTTCKLSAATMNLADVSTLSQSGITDEIILNQIHTTGTVFALATQDIILLKTNGVSDRVVIEMQNSRQRQQAWNAPLAYPPVTYYPIPSQPVTMNLPPLHPPTKPVRIYAPPFPPVRMYSIPPRPIDSLHDMPVSPVSTLPAPVPVSKVETAEVRQFRLIIPADPR